MKRWSFLIIGIIVCIVSIPFSAKGAIQNKNFELTNCLTWNFQDKPTPQTYWSPYLPMPTQQVFRMKIGFRFSTGTIALKDSVKVNFSWDDSEAVAFKTLKLKVKASLKDENFNVFESAFGVYLPNTIEVGFVGVSGLPNIAPWFELPYDFWDLVSFIPKVGSYIASAQDQIGVNMSSKNKLPLGGQAEYHDTRDLISLSLADFLTDAKKEKIATNIFNKIPASTRTALISAIKMAKKVNDAGAEKIVKDLIGKGVEKLGGMASVTVKGDPSYTIKGNSLVVLVKYWIPGKMSGNYPITFTRPDEEFTLNIKMPAFIKEDDKLHVAVESVTYNFILEQNLKFKIALGTIPFVTSPEWDVVNSRKVVTYSQVTKTFAANDYLVEIPIAKSSDPILDYKVRTGTSTATVWWASPNVAMKGTVKVFQGNTLIAQKTEPTFTTSHQVQFSGLSKNTAYRFVTTCVDTQGGIYPEMMIDATTKEKSSYYFISKTELYQQGLGTLRLYDYSISADTSSITFTWKTNVPASTEVFLGLASDFSDNYVAYVKKGVRNSDGSYSNISIAKGYYDSSHLPGDRVLETNHSITITGLDPATTYYYRIASWMFTDTQHIKIVADPTGNPFVPLEYVSTATTKQAPLLNVQCLKAANRVPVKNLTVTIEKQGQSQQCITDTNGFLPQLVLEKNTTYVISLQNHPYYADTSVTVTVPANQEGLMQNKELLLAYKTIPGGYVFDSSGNPIQGVIISATKGTQTKTATTDAKGFYAFDGDWLQEGSYTLTATKDGFMPGTIKATVNADGIFSAAPLKMKSTVIMFNIQAKDFRGNPVSNADVTIKEGNTIKYTGKTNAQGNAQITLQGYRDSNEHAFIVEVVHWQKDSFLNPDYLPVIMHITSFADDVNTLQAVFQPNLNPPVVISSSLWRVVNTFELECKLNIATRYCIAHTKPDGTTSTSTEIWSTLVDNKPVIKRTFDMNGQPYGIHTFTVYARDKYNTQLHPIITLEKEWKFIDVASTPIVYPQIQPSNTSLTFKWKAWYKEAEFGKYMIILENPAKTIEVPNYETTQYTITGLTPGTLYCGTYKVFDNNGNVLFAMQSPQRFCVKTSSQPPVISNVQITPNPANTNTKIFLQAQVSDPDTNLSTVKVQLQRIEEVKDSKGNVIDKKVASSTEIYTNSNVTAKSTTINAKFTVSQPGSYILIIRAEGASTNEYAESEHPITINQDNTSIPVISITIPKQISLKDAEKLNYSLGITINTIHSESRDIRAFIDWGDGTKQVVDIKPDMLTKTTIGKEGSKDYSSIYTGTVTVPCKYQKAGVYSAIVTVEAILDGEKINSLPAKATVEVVE
ncbi:MAG: carboxypeptidase regulatory-like domain-containing protein [Spirochaetota bacterium]